MVKRLLFLMAILFFAFSVGAFEFRLLENRATPTSVMQLYEIQFSYDFYISSSRKDLWDVKFEKVSGSMNPIQYSFGTEVIDVERMPVYKRVCEVFEVPDTNKTGQKQFEELCETVIERYKNVEKKRIVWENGFWGKTIRGGKRHLLKIEMPVNVGEKFEVDIVPVIAGVPMKEYAWVRADCSNKRYVEFSSDFNKGDTVQVTADISGWGISDTNEIWAVDENVSLTIGDIREGTLSSTDFNIFFPVSNSGGDSTDDTYAIYYNCTPSTHDVNLEVSEATVCGWEGWDDCIYDEVPTLDSPGDANNGGVGSFYGTNHITITASESIRANSVMGVRSADINYVTRMKPYGPGTQYLMRAFGSAQGCTVYSDGVNIRYHQGTSKITIGAYNHGEWYTTFLHYPDNAALCDFTIYNEDGTIFAVVSGGPRNGADTVEWLEFYGSISTFDNLYKRLPVTAALGDEIIANTAPELAVWKIADFDFGEQQLPLFAFYDGNLTIDFNVFDGDNHRLTVDLNYSSTATQGFGTVIVDDLNLVSSVCADQDWADSPSSCSWDLIPRIADGNYFILAEVSDGSDVLFDASDKSFGVINPVFVDINLFEFGIFTQNIDLNIDSDVNLQFDYNVATIGTLNSDAFQIFYHVVDGVNDANIYSYTRTTPNFGWAIEDAGDISHELLSNFDGNYNYRTDGEDDHAFKFSAYNEDAEAFEEKDGTFTLNSSDDWARVLLTNSLVDTNVFYNFSFSADYSGVENRILRVYDCNASVADPVSSPNCNVFPIANVTQKDADNYYSVLQVSNDLNQLVGDNNVNLNPDGNHWFYFNCDSCVVARFWTLDFINENSNVDRVRNWTTTTGVGNLATFNNSLDSHLHWLDLDLNNLFDYIISVQDSNGNDYNSAMQRNVIKSVNLAPVINDVTAPLPNQYYTGVIDVNVSISDSPVKDGVVCDVNLLNKDFVPIQTIAFNLSVTADVSGGFVCSTTFDTSTVADGNHFIFVTARETLTTELLSVDFNTDESFGIDNNAPAVLDSALKSDLNAPESTFTFWVELFDNNSGAKGAWYGVYMNGVLDSNAFADVNAGGFVSATSPALDVNNDTSFVIWYAFVDNTDNNWNTGLKSATYQRVTSGIIVGVEPERYFSQDNDRMQDVNRFFAAGDPRLEDQNRFISSLDVRAKRMPSTVDSLILASSVIPEPENILLNLSMGVIILVGILFLFSRFH